MSAQKAPESAEEAKHRKMEEWEDAIVKAFTDPTRKPTCWNQFQQFLNLCSADSMMNRPVMSCTVPRDLPTTIGHSQSPSDSIFGPPDAFAGFSVDPTDLLHPSRNSGGQEPIVSGDRSAELLEEESRFLYVDGGEPRQTPHSFGTDGP